MVSSPDTVVVHPLVLLSVVDHYRRVAKDTRKRVVGLLLGEHSKGRTDVTNSFALPFEEDERDPSIWFLDHSYLEELFQMFRRVNAKEKVVGWYHTGPRLRQSDLDITQLMARYCDNPLLVICEVQPKEQGLPTTAYYAKDEVREDGTQKSQKVFVNIPTEVGATEPEEIGVEHLLRDVKDTTVSTLAMEVGHMVTGLQGLKTRLLDIQQYLQLVLSAKLPVNHDIMYQLQDVFNLLPNLNMEELTRAFSVKTNNMMLVIYVSALIRSVLALHNLIVNKEQHILQQHTLEAAVEGKKKSPTDGGESADKEGSAELKGEAANEEAEHGHPPGASGT